MLVTCTMSLSFLICSMLQRLWFLWRSSIISWMKESWKQIFVLKTKCLHYHKQVIKFAGYRSFWVKICTVTSPYHLYKDTYLFHHDTSLPHLSFSGFFYNYIWMCHRLKYKYFMYIYINIYIYILTIQTGGYSINGYFLIMTLYSSKINRYICVVNHNILIYILNQLTINGFYSPFVLMYQFLLS